MAFHFVGRHNEIGQPQGISMIQKTLTIEVVCLCCCLTIMPDILAVSNESHMPLPMRFGTTLYVGGSGPGNYSKIQDAINASIDGDTVFIYVKEPCYNENIIINTSITLVGENHSVSVEAKNNSLPTIRIVHDSVKIDGIGVPYIWNGGHSFYSNYGFSVENVSLITIEGFE